MNIQNCSTCLHWDAWEFPPASSREGWGRCLHVLDQDAPMLASGDDGADFETAPTFSCSEWRFP